MRSMLIVCAMFAMTGCAEPQIVYPGTGAYEKRVRSFSVSPERAKLAAQQHEEPSAVIDRAYLFSQPYKHPRIDLTGTYVDGDTGRVENRSSDQSLIGGFWASQFYPHGMLSRLPAASP